MKNMRGRVPRVRQHTMKLKASSSRRWWRDDREDVQRYRS